MKKIAGLAIIGIFVALVVLFAKGLSGNPRELNNVTVENPLPDFSLPTLLSEKTVDNSVFVSDKPYYLINFWGSWCPSCYDEHSVLMELAKTEPIYGVNWKDETAKGRAFITNLGNPFKEIIVDNNSAIAIGMGVYGAPETFLVRTDGIIIHRYAGALTMPIWEAEFVPKIKALEAATGGQ